MLNIFKKITHEPLIHFLLLGGVAYIYFSLHAPQQTQLVKPPIDIEDYELQNFIKQYDINNTTVAFDYLTYKKILLQEAYSLELYKEDKSIQNKLLKQMQIILLNARFKEPTEEQLRSYYQKHIQDYSQINTLDIDVIELPKNSDTKLFETLTHFAHLHPIAKHHKGLTTGEVEERFGRYLALKITALAQGKWSKALPYNGNDALFCITHKAVGEPIPFEEVESIVYANYKDDKLLTFAQKTYKTLQNKYTLPKQP